MVRPPSTSRRSTSLMAGVSDTRALLSRSSSPPATNASTASSWMAPSMRVEAGGEAGDPRRARPRTRVELARPDPGARWWCGRGRAARARASVWVASTSA